MLPKERTKRFNQLIKKYLRNEASAEESAFIEKYYESFEHKNNYSDSLPEAERQQLQNAILEILKTKMAEDINTPVIPMRRWLIRLTAAAVLLSGVSVAAYLWHNENPSSNKPVISTPSASGNNAITPGGNRAMLTLNDGTTISLDSSANGTISQQGATRVVKLSNGEIAYRVKKDSDSKVYINTMSTPRGGQYQLTLPDGTKAWLNAASSISYPTAFVEKERRVTMTGEIYFEVAKNPKQPFYVVMGNQTEIKVIGTHFNVNAFADEGTTNTTLLEGSVIITNNSHKKTLKPGQQAQVKDAITVKNDIDMEAVMAWKNGYFSFNKTDLQTVMKQLSRWYDAVVVYEGKTPDMKFWGGISRSSDLSQVIKILEENKVRLRIENKKIIIMSK